MKTNDSIWIKGILKEQSGQSVLVEIKEVGTAWFTPDKYTAMPSTADPNGSLGTPPPKLREKLFTYDNQRGAIIRMIGSDGGIVILPEEIKYLLELIDDGDKNG